MTEPKRRKKKNTGPRPPSPARAKLLELLDDEQWHDAEPIIGRAMRVVPPGIGYRTAEHQRAWMQQRNYGAAKERVRNTDEQTVIRVGQRKIVWDVIKTNPEFEFHPKGRLPRGVKRQIRLVKSKATYSGWRVPEDMSERTTAVFEKLAQGYSTVEVGEAFGVTPSSAYSACIAAKEALGLSSGSPFVVLPALWDRKLLVEPEPDELENRVLEDFIAYRTHAPENASARLGVSRVEYLRARRRLMLRNRVGQVQDLLAKLKN